MPLSREYRFDLWDLVLRFVIKKMRSRYPTVGVTP